MLGSLPQHKHILLEWKNDVGDKDVLWQKEKIDESEDVFKCDTKKDKDKRVCRHTFGINIACWPCGVVVMFKVNFNRDYLKTSLQCYTGVVWIRKCFSSICTNN